jgi:hypothetical protein
MNDVEAALGHWHHFVTFDVRCDGAVRCRKSCLLLGACKPDIKAFCSTVAPGGGRIKG